MQFTLFCTIYNGVINTEQGKGSYVNMLLSTGWRENVQNQLLERHQEDHMNTPDKIKAIFDEQFREFGEPIQELAEMTEKDGIYRYKAYDRAMDIEYAADKITIYQIMFSVDGREVKKSTSAELIFNGKVFVHSIPETQSNDHINTAKIESLMQQCFTIGITVRY